MTLGDQPPGLGGRCQELALAAARVLDGAPTGRRAARGGHRRPRRTDRCRRRDRGRRDLGARSAAAGRDPARDLAAHDAYRALDAAGALLRPGLTGTNVMDMVIGLC